MQAYARANFPRSCSDRRNLDCLCTQYSQTGFTLGEVGLGCVYAQCKEVNERSTAVYRICDGVKDAAVPTHTKLTVLSEGPNASPEDVNEADVSTVSVPASTPTATGVGSSSPPRTTTQPGGQSATRTPSQGSNTAQAAASTETVRPSLNSAQIIGISVAGAATIILAVGAILLATCLRRLRAKRERQARREENERKVSKKFDPERFSPPPSRSISPQKIKLKDPRGGAGGVGITAPIVTKEKSGSAEYYNPDSFNRLNNWLNTSVPATQIGLAISPDADQSASQESFRSTRTISKLLPTRPNPVLKPAPFRAHHESVMSQMTEFEEDSGPGPISPVATTFPLPAGPQHSFPRASVERKPVMNRPNQPPLSVNIPARSARTSSPSRPQVRVTQPDRSQPGQPLVERVLPMPHKFPFPPSQRPYIRNQTGQLAAPLANDPFISPPLTGESSDYIPRYYTRTPGSAGIEKFDRPRESPRLVKINSVSSRSSASGPRSASLRRGRSDSAASCTTFESADPDEPTPPEDEEKQLTPVAESPISGLRYPKVPRPSNQAVPRSPKRTSAEATLAMAATRRLGNAVNLDKMLPVDPPVRFGAGSGDSGEIRRTEITLPEALQVGRRTGASNSPGQEFMLKSPTWVPGVTPTRRAGDLYLSVT